MAKKAIAKIEVDGAPSEIKYYNKVFISEHIFGHHEFEIHVPIQAIEGASGNLLNKSRQFIGKTVKISVESEQFASDLVHNFNGIITNLGFSRSHGSGSDIILKGHSATLLMDEGKHCRSFTELSLNDIFNKVIQDYPANLLNFKAASEFSETIPYVVQYQESNFQFLSRLADRYGEWLFFDGNDLILGPPESGKPLTLVLGSDLLAFDIAMNMKPVNYNYHGYNYEHFEIYNSKAGQATVDNLDSSYGSEVFTQSEGLFSSIPLEQSLYPVPNQAALDTFIKVRREQDASDMVHFHGNSENLGLIIGNLCEIKGSHSENPLEGMESYGTFRVTGLTHNISGDGNYQNNFYGLPEEIKRPSRNPLVRTPCIHTQAAKVIDNVDPDSLGRIKVRFHWQEATETTPWIRGLNPHAGVAQGEHGFYFIPEIDDEVIVEFANGHPDRPYYTGSVYHGQSKPVSSWVDPDNYIKAIKTKSGNEIQLIDKPGNEEIKINTPDGKNSLSLTVSGGGTVNFAGGSTMSITCKKINISASDEINMSANNINISASNNLVASAGADAKISADANMNLKSASAMSVNAGAALSIESSQDSTVKSGANLMLEAASNLSGKATGGNVEIDASAGAILKGGTSADLEGGATATVKGSASATVESPATTVKGDTTVTVQGGMIKLN